MFGVFFKFFQPEPQENNMFATIQPLNNGRFGVIDKNGTLAGTYVRRRDAVRGAARKGLIVA